MCVGRIGATHWRSRNMSRDEPIDETRFRQIQVASTLEAAKAPETQILNAAVDCGFGEEDRFAIKLALEEAMTNAVKHGNCNDCSKHIIVRFAVNDRRAVIIVRDEGCGFQPNAVPDPTASDRIARPNGRGIMLIRAYMDEVYFRDNGCEVYMMKRRN